ncbi:MAG: GTP cyclohydrolase I FolE2 [Methanogenium sp.]|jgi:GTP cyclohydrolase I
MMDKKEVKLPDVQNQLDHRGIGLYRVGVTNVKFPAYILRKNGTFSNISAGVKLFANLPQEAKGHNLSRFSEVLVDFGNKNTLLSSKTLPNLLTEMQKRLGSSDVYARFEFDYYIDKQAPASKKVAPMAYTCAMTGIKKKEDTYFILEVNMIAASVCPCSREMSLLEHLDPKEDLYFNDVDVIKFDDIPSIDALKEKVGMGAHNQRSHIKVELLLDPSNTLWIEDVIPLVEACASAPTYPILKRPDEKFVTELGYNNAKFSEDIARDVQVSLQNTPQILAWSLKVRNEESIHPYDVMSSSKSDNWNFH